MTVCWTECKKKNGWLTLWEVTHSVDQQHSAPSGESKESRFGAELFKSYEPFYEFANYNAT